MSKATAVIIKCPRGKFHGALTIMRCGQPIAAFSDWKLFETEGDVLEHLIGLAKEKGEVVEREKISVHVVA